MLQCIIVMMLNMQHLMNIKIVTAKEVINNLEEKWENVSKRKKLKIDNELKNTILTIDINEMHLFNDEYILQWNRKPILGEHRT